MVYADHVECSVQTDQKIQSIFQKLDKLKQTVGISIIPKNTGIELKLTNKL